MREHAIHETAATNFDRQEHSGISATRAHRVDDRSGSKDCCLSSIKVGCGYSQWNAQFFERTHLQYALEKCRHAVGGCETEARERPAREGGEANFAGNFFQFGNRESA